MECETCQDRLLCLEHNNICEKLNTAARELLKHLTPTLMKEMPPHLNPFKPENSGTLFTVSISAADASCKTIRISAQFAFDYHNNFDGMRVLDIIKEDYYEATPLACNTCANRGDRESCVQYSKTSLENVQPYAYIKLKT